MSQTKYQNASNSVKLLNQELNKVIPNGFKITTEANNNHRIVLKIQNLNFKIMNTIFNCKLKLVQESFSIIPTNDILELRLVEAAN